MCYGRSVEAFVQKGLALLTERTEKVRRVEWILWSSKSHMNKTNKVEAWCLLLQI